MLFAVFSVYRGYSLKLGSIDSGRVNSSRSSSVAVLMPICSSTILSLSLLYEGIGFMTGSKLKTGTSGLSYLIKQTAGL